MKVGIINYHCAHNYGAMLQAYGLQQELISLGYDPEIVDFQPNIIMNNYRVWSLYKLRHPRMVIGTMRRYNSLKKKYKVFEKFKNERLITTKNIIKKVDEKSIDIKKYGWFICGSDQIWNMDLNGGLKEYLLDFVPKNGEIKRISYAASIGTKELSEVNKGIIKRELELFDKISVREDDAVKILDKQLGLNSTQVLDPVFFLGRNDWNKVAALNKNIKEKYVLLYGLEENELFEKTLKFIKENTEYKIINVSPIKKVNSYIDVNLADVGPAEFIGLINDAEVVFTNSFHGTCFSIIYGKKFCTIKHSELNSRIESILRLTGLENHMIEKEIKDLEEFNEIIDYDKNEVNEILKEEIIKSKKFLFDALN